MSYKWKLIYTSLNFNRGFPCNSVGKESACSARDLGSIPGLGRSLVEGNGNPLQYSCLENPMDKRSLADYFNFCAPFLKILAISYENKF